MSKKKRKIRMGSMDVYIAEYNGTIPEDSVLESDENFRGHTKNGATANYFADWYTAKSDDNKVRRSVIQGDEASFSYGNITWDSEAMEILIATARRGDIVNGRRRTEIGGIENDNEKLYIIRGVHRDKLCGDVRITGIGRNHGGWEQVFNNQESVLNSSFDFEPELDDKGTLMWYDEDCMSADTLHITLAAGSTGKTKVSVVSPETAAGNSLKYKIGNEEQSVFYDAICTSGWTVLTAGTTEISAAAGKVITVVEVDANNKAKRCGSVVVIDNIG